MTYENMYEITYIPVKIKCIGKYVNPMKTCGKIRDMYTSLRQYEGPDVWRLISDLLVLA